MSAPPEVVEILRKWVQKAEHDLEAARRIMAVEEDCPFERLTDLNPYAIHVRYIDDWREPQLLDARRSLEVAVKFRQTARERIPPAALD